MAQTKREQYESEREKLRTWADARTDASDGVRPSTSNWPFIAPQDADVILEWCSAYDDADATTTNGGGVNDRWGNSREPATLRSWANSVGSFAREVDGPILEAATEELNQAAQRMKDGRADAISDRAKQKGGLAANSIRVRQNSVKKFLQWAGDRAAADPTGLHIYDAEFSTVDPEDMLSQEEFHDLRRAPEHPRDRAITNLFMFTGQRNHAIRTLRVKDVNLEKGIYRLNTEVDGLKGADRVATWNTLLGATGALQDWMEHHPAPNDGDAYLITERRDHHERDPHSTVSDDTINRVLREAADAAAKEYPAIANKPTHAHAMRHNFVTMCKVVYEMDNDTIKRLIRHKADSTVMETTYAHLSDEDYIAKAEEAFGIREEDEDTTMAPPTCDVCREPLPPNAKICPQCLTAYSEEARGMKEQVQEDTVDLAVGVDNDVEKRILESVRQDVRENPDEYMAGE